MKYRVCFLLATTLLAVQFIAAQAPIFNESKDTSRAPRHFRQLTAGVF